MSQLAWLLVPYTTLVRSRGASESPDARMNVLRKFAETVGLK
jgi:hypothetical protein